MPPIVALALRYPDRRALANGWDMVEGTLALPADAPPPGASVVHDGRVGEVGFLLGGCVVACSGGRRALAVDEAGRPVIEALLEPPKPRGRAVA